PVISSTSITITRTSTASLSTIPELPGKAPQTPPSTLSPLQQIPQLLDLFLEAAIAARQDANVEKKEDPHGRKSGEEESQVRHTLRRPGLNLPSPRRRQRLLTQLLDDVAQARILVAHPHQPDKQDEKRQEAHPERRLHTRIGEPGAALAGDQDGGMDCAPPV